MDKKLHDSLKKFLGENKRNRIENDGVAVWTVILTDLPFFDGKQPRVSVVFSRYQHNQVNKTELTDILQNQKEQVVGMVLAIPSYWLNVDEYLCRCYIEYWVDEFINKNYKTTTTKPDTSCGCPVRPEPPKCPVRPTTPPQPPLKQPLPPGFTPAGVPVQPPLYIPPTMAANPTAPPMTAPRPGSAQAHQTDPTMAAFNRM